MSDLLPEWLRKEMAADCRRRAAKATAIGDAIGYGFGRSEAICELNDIADVLAPPSPPTYTTEEGQDARQS